MNEVCYYLYYSPNKLITNQADLTASSIFADNVVTCFQEYVESFPECTLSFPTRLAKVWLMKLAT